MVKDIEFGTQPSPNSSRRRAAVSQPLIVEREYQLDPERCVAAVMLLLAPRPSPVPSAGETGEIGAGTE